MAKANYSSFKNDSVSSRTPSARGWIKTLKAEDKKKKPAKEKKRRS